MADQVLIIDDDTRLSAMLSDYLSENGFRVRAAATAKAGLDEIGRSLGTSDEGVFAVMSGLAEKLDEFRYLSEDRTPPLGVDVSLVDGRRPKHRRPLRP